MADGLTLNVVPNGLTLNVTSTAVTLNVSPVTITLNGSGVPGPIGPAGPAGSSANIPISDEGTQITAAVSSVNFVGSAVTATNVGNAVTVTVTGGGLVSQADQTVLGNVAGSSAVPVPLTQTQIRTFLGYGGAALLNVGTAAGTVAAGNDSRLSDTRTPTPRTVNNQTGTTYTFVPADATAIVTANNASLVTFNVDTFVNQALPVGTEIPLTGIGVGLLTVAALAGVTLNNPAGASLTLARYQFARLVCIGTNVWELNKGSRPPDGVGIVVNASGQLALSFTPGPFASLAAGATTTVVQGDGTLVTKASLVAGIGAALTANNGSDFTNAALFRKNIGLTPQQFAVPGLANFTPLPNVEAVATTNVASLAGSQAVDGFTVPLSTTTNRKFVLLTAQTTATQNGFWEVLATWARPSWYANGASVSLPATNALHGTVATATLQSTTWACNSSLVVVGTDSPTFTQISARALLPLAIDPAGPVSPFPPTPQRVDTATVTSGSATVLDASITAADLGQPVMRQSGAVSGMYVGTVTPGVSFLLSSSATSQVNINATANSVALTIGANAWSYPGYVICADGSMLACCGNRTGDSASYSRLMGARSFDQGRTWTAPYVIYAPTPGSVFAVGPGTMSRLADGTIVLVTFKQFSLLTGDIVWIFTSPDNGVTWTGPMDCSTGTTYTTGSATGTGPVVEISPGVVAIPFYGANTADTFDSCAVVQATFNGARTAITGFANRAVVANGQADSLNYYEPIITKIPNGNYLMMIRGVGFYYQSISADMVNWSALTVNPIASPDGAPALCATRSGALVLGFRNGVGNAISTSYDNGITWSPYALLPMPAGITITQGRYMQMYEVAPNLIGIIYSMQNSAPTANSTNHFGYLYDGVGVTPFGTPVVEQKNIAEINMPGIDGGARGTWPTISAPAVTGVLWGGLLVAPNTVNSVYTRMVKLQKGTYTIVITQAKAANYGIVTWLLDGVKLGSVDGYQVAPTVYNTTTAYASVVVAVSGWHLMSAIVLSKNAASSNFSVGLQNIWFNRTDNNA